MCLLVGKQFTLCDLSGMGPESPYRILEQVPTMCMDAQLL